MRDVFPIQYYDGESRGQEARLLIRLDAWEIQVPKNEWNEGRIIRCPLNQIRQNETIPYFYSFNSGELPRQTICISCQSSDLPYLPYFPEVLNEMAPETPFFSNQMKRLYSTRWPGVLLLTMVVIGFIHGHFKWVLPAGTAMLADHFPIKYEIELGNQRYKSFLEYYQVDSVQTDALRQFASNIDFQTEYPLEFTVVKCRELNAFAFSGGKIVVFSQILYDIESPEALAGVLAHEVTHVHERHSLRKIPRSLVGYLFIYLLFGDSTGVEAIMKEANYSGSCDLEWSADAGAIDIMNHNRLDVKGLVSLFKIFKKADDEALRRNGILWNDIVHSHPRTNDRIKFAETAVAQQTPAPLPNAALEKAFLKLKKMEYLFGNQ